MFVLFRDGMFIIAAELAEVVATAIDLADQAEVGVIEMALAQRKARLGRDGPVAVPWGEDSCSRSRRRSVSVGPSRSVSRACLQVRARPSPPCGWPSRCAGRHRQADRRGRQRERVGRALRRHHKRRREVGVRHLCHPADKQNPGATPSCYEHLVGAGVTTSSSATASRTPGTALRTWWTPTRGPTRTTSSAAGPRSPPTSGRC
jgi:hypothetical protein